MKSIISLLIITLAPVFADEKPVLYFSPGFTEVGIDSAATVEVWVDDIEALKGFSLKLSYDPDMVEISDAREGTIFSSPSFFASFIDSVAGSIKVESTLFGAGRKVDGSGLLFYLDITGLREGTDTLSFFDLNLRDVDLVRIETEAKNGILAIGEPSSVATIHLKPGKYRLYQNYPNPFNPVTTVQFYVPYRSTVTLRVFNAEGRQIQSPVVSKRFHAGHHSIRFDGSGYASGVYLYRLEAEAIDRDHSFFDTKRMILVR